MDADSSGTDVVAENGANGGARQGRGRGKCTSPEITRPGNGLRPCRPPSSHLEIPAIDTGNAVDKAVLELKYTVEPVNFIKTGAPARVLSGKT